MQRKPRQVFLLIASATAALCMVAAAWVQGARDGYRFGAADGYTLGRAEGIKLEAARLQRCVRWGKWGPKSVVICQENTP